MPSATVGVAISNSEVTKGAISTFSMATIPDRRLFGDADCDSAPAKPSTDEAVWGVWSRYGR